MLWFAAFVAAAVVSLLSEVNEVSAGSTFGAPQMHCLSAPWRSSNPGCPVAQKEMHQAERIVLVATYERVGISADLRIPRPAKGSSAWAVKICSKCETEVKTVRPEMRTKIRVPWPVD